MHKPPVLSVIREKGITGKVSARRQWLTGKSVLQVEVVQEREVITCGNVTSRTYSTFWRDATIYEAFQIKHRVGFIDPPADESFPLYRPAPPPTPPQSYSMDKGGRNPPAPQGYVKPAPTPAPPSKGL